VGLVRGGFRLSVLALRRSNPLQSCCCACRANPNLELDNPNLELDNPNLELDNPNLELDNPNLELDNSNLELD
jgi:hypothetical protein